MRNATPFADLLDELGLTSNKAAAILHRHPNTVRKWRAGLEPTPAWAVDLLKLKMEAKP